VVIALNRLSKRLYIADLLPARLSK
jgi:hypothetical protein